MSIKPARFLVDETIVNLSLLFSIFETDARFCLILQVRRASEFLGDCVIKLGVPIPEQINPA